jgi:TRAP-type C4-dicarboxylate transport system permease small subunit
MTMLGGAFDWALRLFAWAAAAAFGLTAALISVNVALRNFAGTTIYGLLDAVEYGLLAATFLGAPWVLSQGAHVTVDLVTAALPARRAAALARATAAVGFVISAVFLWYALEAATTSAARGSMIRTSFVIPEWWVLSIAPVAFALIAAEFLRQTIRPAGRGGHTGL